MVWDGDDAADDEERDDDAAGGDGGGDDEVCADPEPEQKKLRLSLRGRL